MVDDRQFLSLYEAWTSRRLFRNVNEIKIQLVHNSLDIFIYIYSCKLVKEVVENRGVKLERRDECSVKFARLVVVAHDG